MHPTQNSEKIGDRHIYNNHFRLDELFRIKSHFYSTILYSSYISFALHILFFSLFLTILIDSLIRTHDCIGFLRAIFWMFLFVYSDCWRSNFVFLTVIESQLQDCLMNFFYPFLRRICLYRPTSSSFAIYHIDFQIWGEVITGQQHVIWSVYLSPIIYNLQSLHLWKRILVSCFPT